jgi:two-component system, NtrC family, response regulator GlrR
MLGESPQFIRTLALLKQVAQYDAAVLIEGETGTGKELAARAIHYESHRRDKPFLPVNCGALQDSLVENELFGHMRGAYTGADRDELGIVAAANGGTLFLDEVDSLTPKAQVALLRFLEDQHYRPVGGRTQRTADVRIVSASNRSLAELADADRFRADLLYRLRVMHVHIPPLRARAGDALLLARHFVQVFSRRFRKPILPFAPAATAWIDSHAWPGNVRELENAVCQAFLLASGPEITFASLPQSDDRALTNTTSYRHAKQRAIVEFERTFLSRVIRSTGGNVSEAARLIQTERRHLGRLLKKHGLDPIDTMRVKPAQ